MTPECISNHNLSVLNVFITLCRGSDVLRGYLKDLGYHSLEIEPSHTFSANGKEITVNPELSMASQDSARVLFLESKKGPNVEIDQLQRYNLVPEEVLKAISGLPEPVWAKNPYGFDCVVVGKAQHHSQLVSWLNHDPSITFPLLTVDSKYLRLAHREFECPTLSQTFDTAIELNWPQLPEYISVDHESTDSELGELVVSIIMDDLNYGYPKASLDCFCQDVWAQTWGITSEDYKKALRARIHEILKAAHAYFSEILSYRFFQEENDHFVAYQIPDFSKAKTARTKNSYYSSKLKNVNDFIHFLKRANWKQLVTQVRRGNRSKFGLGD